jgi:DNA end-binding protein Ku
MDIGFEQRPEHADLGGGQAAPTCEYERDRHANGLPGPACTETRRPVGFRPFRSGNPQDMRRPIWQGTMSFGLVTVPVALYPATQSHTVQFHQLERGTSDRIRYRRVNERTGREVDQQDIVKGHEFDDGDYAVVEPEELDDIAPGRSRSLEIQTFVALHEIDPTYFNRSYWLAPGNPDYAHAYHLLVRAMAETDRAGIGEFVMRGREYLTAIRADKGVLALHTLFFADEIRDPAKEFDLPKADQPRGRELAMAKELIESMSGPWHPEEYQDAYQKRVRALLADKRAGRVTEPEAEPAAPTTVVDLTEALRNSLRRGTKNQAADDIDALSKADLMKLARELDIPGRSTMTRDELRQAVRKARAGHPTRKAS